MLRISSLWHRLHKTQHKSRARGFGSLSLIDEQRPTHSDAQQTADCRRESQTLAGGQDSWRRASQSCMGLRRDACANHKARNARKGLMLRLHAYHCARMQRASGIGLVKPCLIGDLVPESELVEEINNVCISYFGQITPQV